ncbi:phytanoyl-CoA dioxygenase family protein [Leptolyngbya sp. CCNP1308]|uniref:phytanoyl-CoA dioxygenase family protein n=1 Tax=Leptolyngbya sp. CCNP1308 TaxID=3110255 RepID=UPI002B210A2E|nr:phytanoyl-CoA dioxygenase family protein [Leptolyngbya sp. CCNP1308]MEA5448313.1 phytanoyl-CoA dioxygenase family protein [Leptolyngbya sp. CCNP1308]
MLTPPDIEQFITNGYVRVEQGFSRELADTCRDMLWADTGCDPGDRTTWQKPVVWLGDYTQAPFVQAANGPNLHAMFDQLAGSGQWKPRFSVGSFPIRFPSREDTGDTGWHVDASFSGEDSDVNDFLSWRINIHSRGRALLMLFLFSDVGELDAPTRIRVGSHQTVARLLAPAGEKGLTALELSNLLSATGGCPEIAATGEAGTVYLCHPFLVHAAQINRGSQPRFMAQPPLFAAKPFDFEGKHESSYVPIEQAIRAALGKQDVE